MKAEFQNFTASKEETYHYTAEFVIKSAKFRSVDTATVEFYYDRLCEKLTVETIMVNGLDVTNLLFRDSVLEELEAALVHETYGIAAEFGGELVDKHLESLKEGMESTFERARTEV